MSKGSSWIVWMAQGGGVGRIPWAPGTFGSLLGLAWTLVALSTGSLVGFGAVVFAGLGFSVWCCGAAERHMNRKDPPSIVLDEIAALPVCFLPWLVERWISGSGFPTGLGLLSAWNGALCLMAFCLFRTFDIWKPWPVAQSQVLPGGWGVTVDDFLAAVYASIPLLVIEIAR